MSNKLRRKPAKRMTIEECILEVRDRQGKGRSYVPCDETLDKANAAIEEAGWYWIRPDFLILYAYEHEGSAHDNVSVTGNFDSSITLMLWQLAVQVYRQRK